MEQYNFRLKEYRKIALKFYLAPWRVLVIDKCGGLRPPQPSTRHSKTSGNPNRKSRRRGAVPAEPLGDRLPLYPPRMAFYSLVFIFRILSFEGGRFVCIASIFYSPALPFRVAEGSIVLADVNGRKIVAENTHRKTLRAE